MYGKCPSNGGVVETSEGLNTTWNDGVYKAARTSGVGRQALSDPCGVGRRNVGTEFEAGL